MCLHLPKKVYLRIELSHSVQPKTNARLGTWEATNNPMLSLFREITACLLISRQDINQKGDTKEIGLRFTWPNSTM